MNPDNWDFDTTAPATDDSLFGQAPTTPPAQQRSLSGSPTTTLPTVGPPVTAEQPVFPPPSSPQQMPPEADRQSRFGYAAPTTPARHAVAPETEPKKQRSAWGWRTLIAFLAGGSLVAGGFAVAQINSDQTIIASSQPAEGVVVPAAALEIDATAEPVAFVAAVLGPSVVQVDTNLGLGSGIIINETTVLTNAHVLEGADSVGIRLSDGSFLPGSIVGADARTDVAVITVPDGSALPPAQLARDVELTVGQLTVAIGSPFELQQTVTSGIISALDRPIQTTKSTINAMIQTDTAINPGNSGGALADRDGRVIGMNTLIQTDGSSNTNIGLGFATPIDTVMKVAERIMAGDDLTPGFMGIQGSAEESGLPGVVVRDVTEGSGSEAAGIKIGDRVLRIDGAPVSSLAELAGLVQSDFPGDTVQLDLVRDGVEITVDVVLGQR